MLTIYNRKLNHRIDIEDSLDWVLVNPKTYDEPPHIIIELSSGFDFFYHAGQCEDCSAFQKALFSGSMDWFVEYENKKYSLVTDSMGSKIYGKNMLKNTISEEFDGSVIQVEVKLLNETELENERMLSVENEDYEKAIYCRDMIAELKKNNSV